jgi:predicted transcriptional regulator
MDKLKLTSVLLRPNQMDMLDRFAEQTGRSRSAVLRLILDHVTLRALQEVQFIADKADVLSQTSEVGDA